MSARVIMNQHGVGLFCVVPLSLHCFCPANTTSLALYFKGKLNLPFYTPCSVSLFRFASMTTLRYAVDCQLIQNYMGSSAAQRNQKLLPHSTTTCALSLNQIIRCQRRDLKHNFSQVSVSQSLGAAVCQSSNHTSLTAVSSMPFQTKMSAQRKTEAVSMSVSIHLGATAVSAGVALYCMRISMTVKKVLNPYCSTLLIADKPNTFWHVFTTQYISRKWLNIILFQLAVITLSTV